ncbi:helix-turn-helix domain-containing protein [Catelliglobosispora koreensis]|uniref:helix-turn-helix domain-containing protein n=1 Tax=Catelliglobosispora koreensis TaxID=129052 RepID=UPI00035C91B5|nr:helix-turn-helix domain-containing protein [Catelliglobosispora koreensis]
MERHNVFPLRQHQGKAKPDRAVYTVSEVAKLLGLSLGSTYVLVRQGEIPARQLGSRWVIPKQRFHAWLEEEDQEHTTNELKASAI